MPEDNRLLPKGHEEELKRMTATDRDPPQKRMRGYFDEERIEHLLNIADKSNPAMWPRLKSIHDRAMAELEAIAAKLATEEVTNA